jgi:alkanesulfonate monooxygenase SsuD/methylene tetrahydromethanopterin reductase-like flavin-dependent oxidoreductase (luciferase family)
VRIGRRLGTTFNYLASQLVSVREAYPSKSYKSLGLLPQLRRQATGPEAQGTTGEGLGIGNPERIVQAMKKWEACGVDRVNFILNCMEEIPQEHVLASLCLFAREVMPHFQSEAVPSAHLQPAGSAAR